MSESTRKEKVINVGITEELMAFMDKMTEKNSEESDFKKQEKIGLEVKRVIAEILKKELEKLKVEFEKDNITDEEWDKLLKKMDKISEVVRWY